MIDKELEFIVDGFVHGERFYRRSAVVATCRSTSATFSMRSIRNKRRRYPDELGDEPVREMEKPAAIRVVCIHAYERCLEDAGRRHDRIADPGGRRPPIPRAGLDPGSEERESVGRDQEIRSRRLPRS